MLPLIDMLLSIFTICKFSLAFVFRFALVLANMKANLQILDAMLAVVMQFTKSPDKAVESAATDELQELAKRRAKVLKQAAAENSAEGASRETALAA